MGKNTLRLCLLLLILCILISSVEGVDDSTAFISGGEAGTTIERYFMANLNKNLSQTELNIQSYSINVIALDEIEIIIKFSVSSDDKYPITIGFDKDIISLQSAYIDGVIIDINQLLYDNFFFCNPGEYAECKDKEIRTEEGFIIFEGPKGINIRGYFMTVGLNAGALHEFKFRLKNNRGNIGWPYPFENYSYEFNVYAPTKRTSINELIVYLNDYNGEASFIQERSDYKKSKLVDKKFTNLVYKITPLSKTDYVLKLDLLPSETLLLNEFTVLKIEMSLKNQNRPAYILLGTLIFTFLLSFFVGFQYGSKQKGKEIVLVILGATIIYGGIFSLIIPFKFLFNIFTILEIILSYILMFILLKIGSRLRDYKNKKKKVQNKKPKNV
ncbi:MAG: hypothetical protein KAT77_01350 [Nanoarchaeota archaeon]|nr:hypothetical protein [Nanoarchaeota archaeon]